MAAFLFVWTEPAVGSLVQHSPEHRILIMKKVSTSNIISWIFGIIVFTIGLLNLLLVHPVPVIVFLLLSFLYYPPVNDFLRKRFSFSVPLVVKIIQGVVIIWFTLGVSDLGDMID